MASTIDDRAHSASACLRRSSSFSGVQGCRVEFGSSGLDAALQQLSLLRRVRGLRLLRAETALISRLGADAMAAAKAPASGSLNKMAISAEVSTTVTHIRGQVLQCHISLFCLNESILPGFQPLHASL